jgi:hypothetical protein
MEPKVETTKKPDSQKLLKIRNQKIEQMRRKAKNEPRYVADKMRLSVGDHIPAKRIKSMVAKEIAANVKAAKKKAAEEQAKKEQANS